MLQIYPPLDVTQPPVPPFILGPLSLAVCWRRYPGDPDPDKMRDKLQSLVDAGVTRVINLMETQEVDHDGNSFTGYADLLCQLGLDAGRQIRCDGFLFVIALSRHLN